MKAKANLYLEQISSIWTSYIYENSFFQKRINFRDNKGTNYFGDITTYLSDTFAVLEISELKNNIYHENFSNAISFLQALYVQQDLIEELLYIFSCESNKGTLKEDTNYSINREIRNELVGHPIRKLKNDITSKLEFISSTVFSNDQNLSNIAYLRYRKSEGFRSEHMHYERSDILERHQIFAEKYLQEILSKCFGILTEYKSELKGLLNVIDNAPLSGVLNRMKDIYESFFKYDYLYKPELIVQVQEKEALNIRYEIAIDAFYYDLKYSVRETINEISRITQCDERIEIEDETKYKFKNLQHNTYNRNFSYGLEKLHQKDDIGFLTLKCNFEEDEMVINELNHMKQNMDDDMEYYSSYKYLSCLLRN